MKRYIVAVMILAISVSAFSLGMEKFPRIWGTDNTSYVETQGSYLALNYLYEPTNYEWVLGTETGTDLITVTCDIEMYMSMYLDASDVYFHIADNRTSMNAYINGWLKSNNGQWLFVSSDLGTKDLSKLVFVDDMFGRTAADFTTPPNDIPISWSLRCGTPDFLPGTVSSSGNAGQLWGLTWLLEDGSVGRHDFTIKINIAPEDYQPDGRYEMDPVVTAAPVL